MSRIPDFTKVEYGVRPPAATAAAQDAQRRRKGSDPIRRLAHPRRHPRQALLHAGRHRRARFPRRLSRHRALPARAVPDDVRHPAVDHPAIRRLLHGRGLQRLLPPQHRRRAKGPLRRLRPRHPPRLRQRSSARARRRRHGRRGDRLHLRHAHAVCRHPARRHDRVDDHERRGAARARPVHRRRRGAGRAGAEARRHHPERHPQRVHGAQHLHLPARAVDAHHLRHLRLHVGEDAEVQLDLHLRLSHAGGRSDGRPRARLHAGRRRRVRARGRGRRPRHRRVRAQALLLLGDRHEFLHGDRQDARRPPAVGQAHQGRVRAQGCPLAGAAHALPDQRLEPHRPGRLQQRHPHRHRGPGRHPRRHAVAAHQCARRGDRPADRFLRPHRPQHAALHPAGDRHLPRHRSVGRQPLRRAPHL